MAKVTLALPDDVARKARAEARRRKKSLSAFISELVARETISRQWSQGFVDLLTRGSANLVEPPDPPLEEGTTRQAGAQ